MPKAPAKKPKAAKQPKAPAQALRLEWIDPADLEANELNFRRHPEKQQAALRDAIGEVGWAGALLYNEKTKRLIDGHARRELFAGQGPVPVLVGSWSPADERKILATLDPIAGMATIDADALSTLLEGVTTGSAAIEDLLAGIKVDAGLLDGPTEVTEDEAPEAPAKPITKPGDLWLLGEHRLLCGDSTKGEDVARLMGGELADILVSDPPYGVDYVGKTAKKLVIANDGRDGLGPLLAEIFRIALSVCKPGACWYVTAPAWPQFADFAAPLAELGIWRQTLVWAKQSLVMGHSDYHYQHEAIFYGWAPGAAHQAPPDRAQTTLWEIDRPTASREHPTMKPVALFAKCLSNSSEVNSLAFEPCSGSGTTIIAAEQLNRRCNAMEISPAYVQVALERWAKLTGKQPVRDGDGKTLAQLLEVRNA